MNIAEAQQHLKNAEDEFYPLLPLTKTKDSVNKVRAELSAVAATLDSDDPDQAEALARVIAADDAIRQLCKADRRAKVELDLAIAALKKMRENK